MQEVYIYDVLRTPRGRGRESGALHPVKPVELLHTLFSALSKRSSLDPHGIDDVILGCVTQIGEQGGNIAKVAALHSGLPSSVPGITINRYCTSGLDACNFAAMKIMVGTGQLVVAGGVESMSRVPMLSDKGSFYSDRELIRSARFVPMGLSADLIASLHGISREACDAYAVQSQRRAAAARGAGAFNASLIPVVNPETANVVATDECIRPDTRAETLAAFEPSFTDYARHYRGPFKQAFPDLIELKHIHHRGNSPATADGASLVLLGSASMAGTTGLKPRARIRAMANAAGNELLGLTGGIQAARAVLGRAGLKARDLHLVEFNEAFAATSIKFYQDLGLDPAIVNVNGGAIALGHAMGATGASLLGTLLDELERRDQALGLVAVSGAAGVGTATVIERV